MHAQVLTHSRAHARTEGIHTRTGTRMGENRARLVVDTRSKNCTTFLQRVRLH